MYNRWLPAHRTPKQIEQLRTMAGVKPGSPVPLMTMPHEEASAPPKRFCAEAEYADAQAMLLQPLDGAGHPAGESIRATLAGADWKLPLGHPVTTWYEVIVQR